MMLDYISTLVGGITTDYFPLRLPLCTLGPDIMEIRLRRVFVKTTNKLYHYLEEKDGECFQGELVLIHS